jgi:hypothetical protein
MLLLVTTRSSHTPPREILPLLQRVLDILWIPCIDSIGLAERHSACRIPVPLGLSYILLGRFSTGYLRSGVPGRARVSDIPNCSTRLDDFIVP